MTAIGVGVLGCNADDASLQTASGDGNAGSGFQLADAQADAGTDAGTLEDPIFVKVGIPDMETQLQFTELAADGDITVQRGGQGGSHALVAIQCKGIGKRVYYRAGVKNLDGDGEVFSADLPRPRPIACDDNDICKVSPVFVQLGGVAPPEEWDGLHVQLSATVWNDEGVERTGYATGYLRTDKNQTEPVDIGL